MVLSTLTSTLCSTLLQFSLNFGRGRTFMRFSPDAMFVAEGNVGLKSICVDLRDRGYPVSKALEAAGAMLRKVILSGRLSVRILTANSEKVTPQVPLSFFWPAPRLNQLFRCCIVTVGGPVMMTSFWRCCGFDLACGRAAFRRWTRADLLASLSGRLSIRTFHAVSFDGKHRSVLPSNSAGFPYPTSSMLVVASVTQAMLGSRGECGRQR